MRVFLFDSPSQKLVAPQADGSEYRLPGDGHWPSFNVSPGDLVVCFRHKALGGLGSSKDIRF